MTAVAYHHCGAWVYELRRPDRTRIALDPEAVDGGEWMPAPDGRTAERSTEPWGHAEHSCVPDGQETLL